MTLCMLSHYAPCTMPSNSAQRTLCSMQCAPCSMQYALTHNTTLCTPFEKGDGAEPGTSGRQHARARQLAGMRKERSYLAISSEWRVQQSA